MTDDAEKIDNDGNQLVPLYQVDLPCSRPITPFHAMQPIQIVQTPLIYLHLKITLKKQTHT